MAIYDLTPVNVPKVETKYRSIKTKLPVPESLPIFDCVAAVGTALDDGSAADCVGQGGRFYVSDRWGNRWIDWSSGVLITNAGHGRKEIRAALREVIDRGLLASYVFVHEQRARLAADAARPGA